MTDHFVRERLGKLDDFWRRREAAATCDMDFEAFGHSVHFTANDPRLLNAARLSALRYSRSSAIEPSIRLHVAVDSQLGDEPVPADWPSRLRCMAANRRLMVNCDPWVNACGDLDSWSALALVSDSLAQRPFYLSRYVCDRFLLNCLMEEGLGRLHAACVCRESRAVLLVGPGDSGKSTTALRLALSGYAFLSDGMTHVRFHDGQPELLAYPVAESRIRYETLALFPELSARGEPMLIGEHTKRVLDLHRLDCIEVVKDSAWPGEVIVAHLVRTGADATAVRSVPAHEMLELVWPEASFVEDERVMARNLAAVRRLLAGARCYLLELGTDPESLLSVIARL